MTTIDQLNFLPDDYRRRKHRRRTVTVGLGLALSVAAALGIGVCRANSSIRRAEQRRSEISRNLDQSSAKFMCASRQTESRQKIVQQAASAASLVDSMPRSNILAELTNCLPAETSLIELTLESRPRPVAAQASVTAFDLKKSALKARQAPEMAMTDITPSDVNIRLTGLADTDVQVAQYLSQLSNSPLFQDVSLLISESYEVPAHKTVHMRRFQIQMTLKDNARLQSKPPRDDRTTADSED